MLPSKRGNGLNLRALQWLNKFSPDYNIYILLCPLTEGPISTDSLKNITERVFRYDANRSKLNAILLRLSFRPESWVVMTPHLNNIVTQLPATIHYVFCLRMYNLPLAKAVLNKHQGAKLMFDLDELESLTRFKTALRAFKNGAFRLALRNFIDASLYRLKEHKHLSTLDNIYVSAQTELEHLHRLFDVSIGTTFTNKLPAQQMLEKPLDSEWKFLFVGNLGHYPNVDAVWHIVNDIVPQLKVQAPSQFKFYIVGKNAPDELVRKMQLVSEIHYHNDIDDVKTVYEDIHASIVPLYSGGGSSFKIIEALMFGKPVITTPVGMRGFDLERDVEVLVGGSTQGLVDHIVELMNNPIQYNELVINGRRWVEANYLYTLNDCFDQ